MNSKGVFSSKPTRAQQVPFLPLKASGRTTCWSALGVWLGGPAPPGAPPRPQQSVLEHFLGSVEGSFSRNSHMGHHAHPFPGTAIHSPHRAGRGDGDVEMSVIHVVSLWWLAAPAGHFPDYQRPAQLLHDVGKFLRGAGCQRAGQNGHVLLGAIAFPWETEDGQPSQHRGAPAFSVLCGAAKRKAWDLVLWPCVHMQVTPF